MRFQCSNCKSLVMSGVGQTVNFACPNCGASIAPPSELGPGCVLGDYLIERTIGAGGMGTVFKATQLSKPRDVALKVLRTEFTSDEAMVQSFVGEARLASRLRHPNIIEAYDVALEEGQLYFAMEYVDGPSLTEYVAANGPFDAHAALGITLQMAEALSYAWNTRRMVHRDIKPDNILYTHDGTAKLADLGLAGKLGGMKDANGDGEFFGTPQCLAPELLFNSEASASSDIYALGITLWFMLVGHFPFDGGTPEQTLELQQTATLPDFPTQLSEYKGLKSLIYSMVAKRPCHRYGSYAELMEDIRRVMDGNPPRRQPSPYSQTPIDRNSSSPLQPPSSDEKDDATREEDGNRRRGWWRLWFSGNRRRGWLLWLINLIIMTAVFLAMCAAFYYFSKPTAPAPPPVEESAINFSPDTFDNT